jgi:hypothetical protein
VLSDRRLGLGHSRVRIVVVVRKREVQRRHMPALLSETTYADARLPARKGPIWTTNAHEQVNKEVKWRTNVVAILPNNAFVIPLVGTVLAEVHVGKRVAEPDYLSEVFMALVVAPPTEQIDTIDNYQL